MPLDPFLAFTCRFDVVEFLVPVFDRTNAYRSADAEDIVAVSFGKKRVIRIPITLR